MISLDSIKSKFSIISYKHFMLILAITIIFLIAAVYTYRRYVSPSVSPTYVANSEFVQEGAGVNQPSEVADLYFFHTTWCPHCKKSMPIWQELKKDLSNKEFKGVTLNFIDVDCDKETALAEKFNVQGYPTIKLVKGNQIIEYDAKPTKENLMEFLNTSL
jgi:thioredoxin 1